MKKNNPLLHISCMLTLLAFCSCEKEIPYEGNDEEQKLVINAVEENDSLVRVYLEQSTFFLSNDPDSEKYIKSGAVLTLTNQNTGEVFQVSAPVMDNLYEFPHKMIPNTSYKIEVSHTKLPTATAEMLSPPDIKLLSVDTAVYYNKFNEKYRRATLNWNDPAEENYYFVKVMINDTAVLYDYNVWISCTDPAFPEGTANEDPNNENAFEFIYFDDKQFNGTNKKLEIHFYGELDGSITFNSIPDYSYQLISVNKEAYQYFISAQKAQNVDFFTEPVKVFKNINNGFGIFGAMNRSVIIK